MIDRPYEKFSKVSRVNDPTRDVEDEIDLVSFLMNIFSLDATST
jgi:hypothetical protein